MATAITAGLVGIDATVDNADPTDILDGTVAIRGIEIECSGSSAAAVKVRVRNANEDTHGTTYDEIPAGTSRTYWASADNAINSVLVDGDGATATFSWRCVLR